MRDPYRGYPRPDTRGLSGIDRPRYTPVFGEDSGLDAAADEIAAQLIKMAEESPEGLAFLDRVVQHITRHRCAAISPLREV